MSIDWRYPMRGEHRDVSARIGRGGVTYHFRGVYCDGVVEDIYAIVGGEDQPDDDDPRWEDPADLNIPNDVIDDAAERMSESGGAAW